MFADPRYFATDNCLLYQPFICGSTVLVYAYNFYGRKLVIETRSVSINRYELREDRKKEEVQTAAHMDALKRDIVRFIGLSASSSSAVNSVVGGGCGRHGNQILSRPSSVDRGDGSPAVRPAPAPPMNGQFGQAAAVGVGNGGGSIAAIAPDELDFLKKELATSLRNEIHELVREVAVSSVGGGGVRNIRSSPVTVAGHVTSSLAPPLNTDLYQTHLYTQL